MKWFTRRVDQGQTVAVSYAYDSRGGVYRCSHDRSDGTTLYWRGELDWNREPEHVDHDREPCVKEWIACDEPADTDR